jgi:hypothetical protein
MTDSWWSEHVSGALRYKVEALSQRSLCESRCMASICIGRAALTVIQPLQKSAKSYFLSCWAELLWKKLSRKWVCVYTGAPTPTYLQPIMSMQSDMEPSTLLQHHVGWSSIWPLEAPQLRHTLQSELPDQAKLAFNPSVGLTAASTSRSNHRLKWTSHSEKRIMTLESVKKSRSKRRNRSRTTHH